METDLYAHRAVGAGPGKPLLFLFRSGKSRGLGPGAAH